MTIFRGSLRGGWLTLVVVLLLQGVGVLWTARAGWIGWLPAGGATLERTSLLGASILGAGVAWAAVSLRVHSAEAWARASARSVQELYRGSFWWGLSASVTATSCLAVVVAIFSRQSISTEALMRYLLSVLAVFAVSACAAGLGVLSARFLPPFVAVASAFVLPYGLAVGLGGYLAESRLSALAVPDFRLFEYAWPPIETPAFRAAGWVLVGVAIIFTLHGRPSLRDVSLGLSSASIAGLLYTVGMVESIPGANSIECEGKAPVVCFDGTQESLRGGYLTQLREGLEELPPAHWPDVVAATEQGGPVDAVNLPPVSGKYRPSRTIPPGAVTAILGDVVFDTRCSASDRVELSAAMTLWWRDRLGLPVEGGTYAGQNAFSGTEFDGAKASASRIEELTAQRFDEVVVSALGQLSDCSLPAQPLP